MTVLKPAPVSTRQLRWDAASRVFTADISDLNGFGQVWDDACDTGFTLLGPAGREAVVVVTHEEVDGEGDTRWWSLTPISRDHHFTVTVFND